jgi:hypothetical protein
LGGDGDVRGVVIVELRSLEDIEEDFLEKIVEVAVEPIDIDACEDFPYDLAIDLEFRWTVGGVFFLCSFHQFGQKDHQQILVVVAHMLVQDVDLLRTD